MRKTLQVLIIFCIVLKAGAAFGQSYTGTYVLSSQGVTVTLVLTQDAQGKIAGTFSSTNGTQFQMDGTLEEDLVVGVCSGKQGSAYFEGELEGNTLRMTMFNMDADNNPDYANPKNLEFVRQGTGGTAFLPGGQNPLAPARGAGSARNPLSPKIQSDPFVGTFVGQDLKLSLQSSGGKYSGTLISSGQTFPLVAQKKEGSSLEGTFESGGSSFSFSATLADEVMKFSTEGAQYALKRQGAGQASTPQSAIPLQTRPQEAQQAGGEGNVISDPQRGFSFTAPAGWKAQEQQDAYLLGSDTDKGFIAIMPHDYGSIQQMSAEAGQGITDEGSGIQLQPVSEFQQVGKNGLAGEFSGMVQGKMARACAIGLISPNGGGITILAAVEAGSYSDTYPQLVQAIASTVTFMRAEAGGGPTDMSLMKYFAGKYYSYTSGSTIYGSAGTERQVMLCPNGQFSDSSESSASGQGWGGAGTRQGAARWQIQGNKTQGTITITRPDGRTEPVQYQVTAEEGVILFNGIKFAFAGAAACR
jgi:hypothetical protein